MSITIGDAVLWIRGKPDKLDDDLRGAEKQVTGWSGRISDTLKNAISVAAGQMMAQGIGQISNAIQNLASEVVSASTEYVKQVEEMARATGATAEEASKLIQVADDQRISVEELSSSIALYSRQQAAAGRATDITVEEIGRLSDEYLKLAPGTERNAFLMDNFGRSGMNMARLMEQGSEAIREQADAVGENLIVTEEAIKRQREYEEALDGVQDAMSGIKVVLGGAITPSLIRLANLLSGSVLPSLERLAAAFAKLPQPARDAAVGVGIATVGISKIIQPLVSLAMVAKMAGVSLGGGGLAAAASGAASMLVGLGATIVGAVLYPIGLLIAAIAVLIFSIINMGPQALIALGQLFGIVAYYVTQLIAEFGRLAPEVGRKMSDFWSDILRTAADMARSVWDWFRNVGDAIIKGIWDGLKAGWNWLIDQVEKLAQDLYNAAKNALGIGSPAKLFVPVGLAIPGGIGVGVEQGTQPLIADLQRMLTALPVAMGGGRISVGRIEYHGSFSRDELRRLDRRNQRIASNTLAEVLR